MDECMTRQVQQIEHMQLAAEVEQLCGALFERWCARRSVVALGCLMRHWPIVSRAAPNIHSLSSSLEQLADCEQDALDTDERELILKIIGIANHIF
ncbi:hypothetical protein B0G62_106131 [Paraburkholderia eburnea]|uniref:Uncharacterized protein n=1 Tax=Paraburkholderia eburnea TaxID=1189126 RepID=A0A2S4MAR4_9BURK|nr:hypothetical protein [Paraburkholderia eburnea]POR51597.1 hypothetical protein B0G62_106131 [Paraburkholderia eburnea]PRZ22628.1 hypothetical protein BX588_106131 [Paraburkholderia eburnea]